MTTDTELMQQALERIKSEAVSLADAQVIALDALRSRLDAPAHECDYPECSGDPRSCPENEGYGCCSAPAQAAVVDERAEFEAWASDNWPNSRWPDGAWIGWQARAAKGG